MFVGVVQAAGVSPVWPLLATSVAGAATSADGAAAAAAGCAGQGVHARCVAAAAARPPR